MTNNLRSGSVQSLYNSRQYILKHLERQGYNTSEYDNFCINDVNTMHANEEMDMYLSSENGKKTYVKYYIKKSLRPANINDMVFDIYNNSKLLDLSDMLVIITKEDPNKSLINHLKQLYSDKGVYIVIISINRLQFDIMEHSYVPKYEKMSSEELEQFKKRYNINSNKNLPTISRFDPVAIVNGIKPGEIYRIIRPNKSTITDTYYRCCVNV